MKQRQYGIGSINALPAIRCHLHLELRTTPPWHQAKSVSNARVHEEALRDRVYVRSRSFASGQASQQGAWIQVCTLANDAHRPPGRIHTHAGTCKHAHACRYISLFWVARLKTLAGLSRRRRWTSACRLEAIWSEAPRGILSEKPQAAAASAQLTLSSLVRALTPLESLGAGGYLCGSKRHASSARRPCRGQWRSEKPHRWAVLCAQERA